MTITQSPGGKIEILRDSASRVPLREKITFTGDEAAVLRKAIGVPDLTTDEAEVVALERELRQAREDDLIVKWGYGEGDPEQGARHGYIVQLACEESECFGGRGVSRVEAARAAAQHLRSLRQPKLPEPDEMTVEKELRSLGWVEIEGVAGYAHPGHDCIWRCGGETGWGFTVRALLEARRLAAKQ